MPQASERLRAMFSDDRAAWEILRVDFADDRGVIRPVSPLDELTPAQFDAIDYLCDEWDYGYEPFPQNSRKD